MEQIFTSEFIDLLAKAVIDRLEVKPAKTPRMRTLAEAAEEIKKQDPHTCITPYYIRQLVMDGKLSFIAVGTKRLIDLDELYRLIGDRQRMN